MKENSNSNKRGFWKSNWHWMLFILFWLLVFPYILNKLILIDRYWNIVGGPKEWLAFWPSYLSALASAVMIAYTAMTLKNNKEQLDELKRQWEEEHKPNVSVSFNIMNSVGAFRIVNTSVVEVKELSIIAEFYHDGQKVEYATFPELTTLKIKIEPKGIRNVRILDLAFKEHNTDYFILQLNYNGQKQEPIKVFCNQIYTIGDNIFGEK